MKKVTTERVRKLSQQYAFTSIQMHETIGRKAGLTGTDHKYLGFIMQQGQMTAGELAQLSGLTTGAVTGLIDRFEKKQLVKRSFAANDRRKVIVEPLTENIMALLAPLYKEYRSEAAVLHSSFTEKELQVIERYFNQAIGIMQATTDQLNHK
jgi:DNA-binding MarR family transcriptional regulator